jgi:hypothetical protein
MLVGQPIDKQGLPVGLYNPIFNEFKALLSDPTAMTDITYDQLAKTSSFCTTAVAIYWNEKDRHKVMVDLIENLLYTLVNGILVANNVLFWNGKMTWEKAVAMQSNKDVFLSETIESNPTYTIRSFIHLLL